MLFWSVLFKRPLAPSVPICSGVPASLTGTGEKGATVNLMVNGKKHEHCGGGTVPALLAELGATPEHTVLTINGDLVPSKDWNDLNLANGDVVELLTFVGGG